MKAIVAWSSGKDCALALNRARCDGVPVTAALTTVTETFGRVSIHGVREEVLRAQCDAAALAPLIVPIPYPCPNEVYEERMAVALAEARRVGVTHVIFGDLFLDDVRAYRERRLAGTGIAPLFPLWGLPTATLARDIVAGGIEAYLVSVDLSRLPERFCGRRYDAALIAELPPEVDPCGENGEFHTCVVAGPMFSRRVAVTRGERVVRDGFAYCDLRLAPDSAAAR